jgi:hypothetical protein
MARKKRVQKRGKKVAVVKSRFITGDIKKDINLVFNNFLLFVALCLVSFVFFRFLQNDILVNLFQVMAMVFGSVSVAFLIIILVLLITKAVRKK